MRYIPEIPYPVGSKERKKALGRRHYQMHRQKLIDRQKIYRFENPEKVKQKSRNHHNSVRGRSLALLKSAEKRSRDRGYECTVDFDWIKTRLEKGTCELTGITFIFETRVGNHRNPYSPSLDRRDNLKGYTKENCRIILWALNMAFADWGQDIYFRIARQAIEYDL